MEIEDEGLPLREDATFKIRPRLFLEGNYFIEASPGTPQASELDDGAVVPATQTAGPVSAGDLLKTFESNTRKDVGSVLDEYGRALAGGGGAAFNRSTRYWEKAYGNSAKVNDAALGQRDGDLSGYVRNSGRVASALSRNETQLRDLVTNLAEAGGAFARQQAALSAAVAELPRTLNQGFRTLGEVDRALPPVRALARELTPAVRTSPATLDASIPLARELRGIIGQDELGGVARSLSVAAPALARFARGGVDLQGQQRLLASCLNNVSLPTSEATVPDPIFPATGPVYEEFVKWMPGLAGGARSFDSNAIYSRSIASTANFAYPLGKRVWFNTQPLRGINPAPADMPPLQPTVPCETQEPPDLRLPAAPATAGDQDPARRARRDRRVRRGHEASAEAAAADGARGRAVHQGGAAPAAPGRARRRGPQRRRRSMKRAIRAHLRDFIAILVLVVLATAIGIYIVTEQRLRLPWESDPIELKASFSTAQAVIPGQGQTVRVAGVEIGDVTGSELENGKAVVTMEIDPEYEGMVREDATALLRPRTALKDMFVELDPGSPDAAEADGDFVVPISNTLPDVNPDEFLSVLDADTRQYLKLLLKGAGDGLKGRGERPARGAQALRAHPSRPRPRVLGDRQAPPRAAPARDLAQPRVARAGAEDDTLAQLVDSASRSFGTLADRQAEVSGDRPPTAGDARSGHPRAQPRGGHGAGAGPGGHRAPRGSARADALQPRGAPVRAWRRCRCSAVTSARSPARPSPPWRSWRSRRPTSPTRSPACCARSRCSTGSATWPATTRADASRPTRPAATRAYLFHSAWGGHQLNGVLSWADAHGSGAQADQRRQVRRLSLEIMRTEPARRGSVSASPRSCTDPRLCADRCDEQGSSHSAPARRDRHLPALLRGMLLSSGFRSQVRSRSSRAATSSRSRCPRPRTSCRRPRCGSRV